MIYNIDAEKSRNVTENNIFNIYLKYVQ